MDRDKYMKETKIKKRIKQPPSQLAQDNEGNWYLIPEDKIVVFESTLNLLEELQGEGLEPFRRYQVDAPNSIRVLKWQEI
jgi:hypothetical protein